MKPVIRVPRTLILIAALALSTVSGVAAASASTTVTSASAATAADDTAVAASYTDTTASTGDGTLDLTRAQAAALPHNWATPIGTFHDIRHAVDSRFCSGSVIYSPHGNLVLGAAHCLQSYNNADLQYLRFEPDYANGAPNYSYGVWQVSKIVIATQYDPASHYSPYDYALVVLKAYNGENVATRTGYLNPQINATFSGSRANVTVAGYQNVDRGLSDCRSNTAHIYRTNFVEADCAGNGNEGSGTSGGPWITTNTYNLVGIMGGWARGGDGYPRGTNFSPYLNSTFAHYWAIAERY